MHTDSTRQATASSKGSRRPMRPDHDKPAPTAFLDAVREGAELAGWWTDAKQTMPLDQDALEDWADEMSRALEKIAQQAGVVD